MDHSKSSVRKLIEGDDTSKWIADSNRDLKLFTENEMKTITSNYRTILGRGASGEVYEGVLEDGSMVAVKRLIQNVKADFVKELIVDREINHKNVVRLVGYCIDKNALTMVVTEYIPKGNLSDALHKDSIPISLDTRLRIATECAEALGYMHSQMYTRVIHGDVKPANILLDDRLGAKISDFGISRLVNSEAETTLYTLNVIGSLGYMDPLFAQDGRLTAMSDVYSFGVVLLELITRKKARTENGEMNLVGTFTQALAKGARRVREMFDAEIATSTSTSADMKTIEEIAKLAGKCLALELNKRPAMLEVAERLRKLGKVPVQRQEGLFAWSLGRKKQQEAPAQTSADNMVVEQSRQSITSCDGSLISFSSTEPVLSSDLEDVLEESAEALGKDQNLPANGSVKDCPIAIVPCNFQNMDHSKISIRKLIEGDEMFDAEIATSSEMKTVEEMAKLEGKCLTLELTKGSEMLEVAKNLHKLGKAPVQRQERTWLWGRKKQQEAPVQTCADDMVVEPSGQSITSCDGSVISFSSAEPALSSDLEYVLEESAKALDKDQNLPANGSLKDCPIAIVPCNFQNMDHSKINVRKIIEGDDMFDTEMATSSEMKTVEEMAKLEGKCPALELTKGPEMLEVAKNVHKLGKAPVQRQERTWLWGRKKQQEAPVQTCADDMVVEPSGQSITSCDDSVISFSSAEPGLSSVLEDVLEESAEATGKDQKLIANGSVKDCPIAIAPSNFQNMDHSESSVSKLIEEDDIFDTKIATSSDMKTVEEMANLESKCLALELTKRPEMLEVVERIRKLGKVPVQRQERLFSWPWGRKKQHEAPAQTPAVLDVVAEPSRRSITCWNGSVISFSSAASALSSGLEDVLDASGEALGKGTVGTTYKVVLDDGSAIAVKRLEGVELPEAEFEQRMAAIGAVECGSVLPVLGYHFTDEDKFVSYSCMPMGSLAEALHGEGGEPMGWDQRLCILSNVVEALESIHSLGPTSRHGNIKSSNVLLEEDAHTARVSEHGLGAAFRPFSKASSSGYRAPEVTEHRHASQRSDVYSFGILMLELFTGKAPVDEARAVDDEGVDLLRLVSSVAREKWVTRVLDRELQLPDKEMELVILQLLQLAIDCCSHNANVRPIRLMSASSLTTFSSFPLRVCDL